MLEKEYSETSSDLLVNLIFSFFNSFKGNNALQDIFSFDELQLLER